MRYFLHIDGRTIYNGSWDAKMYDTTKKAVEAAWDDIKAGKDVLICGDDHCTEYRATFEPTLPSVTLTVLT